MIKKEQNEEIETELSKIYIKKEKKKENKEIIKINEMYFQRKEQDEETAIGPSKKRKRNI